MISVTTWLEGAVPNLQYNFIQPDLKNQKTVQLNNKGDTAECHQLYL